MRFLTLAPDNVLYVINIDYSNFIRYASFENTKVRIQVENTSKLMYYGGATNIYDYTTSGGKNLIMEYVEALPAPSKAEILAVRQLIREKGVHAFSLLVTRQLYKKLWEIKISQERVMYVIQNQESVFFLNICKKQKGKAEKQELKKAIKRAKAEGLF